MLLQSLRLLVTATPLLLCLGWVAPALAGQVRLAWDPTTTHTDGTPATDLAGYHLYYWQGSPSTRQRVDVGQTTTYTLTGLVEGGTYALAVTAYDTAGNESADSNTLTVTIASVNHAPLALANASVATAGTPLTLAVLANDTDADGNPLAITAVSQGAHGTVTISGSKVIYTPVATFVGTDSFTYTVSDGQVDSATAVTVMIIVRPAGAHATVRWLIPLMSTILNGE
jgi:Bacterial Ig domain